MVIISQEKGGDHMKFIRLFETKNKDKLKNHKRKRLFKKIWYWTKFTFLVLAFVYVFCGITFLVFSTFNCL